MKKLVICLIFGLAIFGFGRYVFAQQEKYATTASVTLKLSLGMTKQKVLEKCGNPYLSGSILGQDGKNYDIFAYEEQPMAYVYFLDDKVIYYGEIMIFQYNQLHRFGKARSNTAPDNCPQYSCPEHDCPQ